MKSLVKRKKKEKYKKLRAINKVKVQDYYLKLMVDSLYQDLFNQPLDKSLSDFYVSKTEREKIKADAKANQELNDSFLWNKTVSLKGRITATPKLKDLGKYKRAIRDEKLPHYLPMIIERGHMPYKNLKRKIKTIIKNCTIRHLLWNCKSMKKCVVKNY